VTCFDTQHFKTFFTIPTEESREISGLDHDW